MRQFSLFFLCLLVFVMPWQEMFSIPGLASAGKMLGVVVLLLGLMAVLVTGRLRFPLSLLWIALYAGWCAATTQWAINRSSAFSQALTYLQLLVFVWLVCQLADTPKSLMSLMRAFILGTSLLVANLYLGYVHLGVALNTDEQVRYSAQSANANGIALDCALSILFAFYLITRREKTGFELPNWFYWGFIVAAGPACLLTGSRSGAMCLAVAGFVLLGRLWRVNWRIRLGVVLCAISFAILVPRLVGSGTLERIGQGTSGSSFKDRLDDWRIGLKAWAQTPVLGIGAGSYDELMYSAEGRHEAAHNTFVSVLVETGLVGFILYFAFWVIVFRRIMLLPKAEWFFWLGVFACYLPSVLSNSGEYDKLTWFLGALVLWQSPQPRAADERKPRIAPSYVRGPELRPPRPRLS